MSADNGGEGDGGGPPFDPADLTIGELMRLLPEEALDVLQGEYMIALKGNEEQREAFRELLVRAYLSVYGEEGDR